MSTPDTTGLPDYAPVPSSGFPPVEVLATGGLALSMVDERKDSAGMSSETSQILPSSHQNMYTWASIEEYKAFMMQRIEECRRALKDTGSIFVHCDSSASHHLRLILDEVFGPGNFQSEIIWVYRRWSNT